MNHISAQNSRVAVVGGGLAGLAAGCALASSGFRVTLFERRPYFGGRASSYQHPGTGEVVDNCQHVLLGCCTNLIKFYEQLKVENKIRWYDRLTFLEPGGRSSAIEPSKLPAPFHNAPAFLRASCLSFPDKLLIGAAMTFLVSYRKHDTGESFLAWLNRHQQTKQAIERFWKPILVSALNEELDRMSVPNAAQVVRESFLKSAAAGRMGVPSIPLTDLYSVAGDYISARGGGVRLRCSVESFSAKPDKVNLLVSGDEMRFDYVVLAVPFDVLSRMLPQTSEADPLQRVLARFETSPITGIHLWFDRQITDLDHAVLLDRTIQWMFHKSRLLAAAPKGAMNDAAATALQRRLDTNPASYSDVSDDAASASAREPALASEGGGSYVELVVSSSKTLIEKSRAEIVEMALAELREFFPGARDANLVKSTVIKEVHATYSPQPGVDAYRPHAETVWPRVFLAGDWTATGWPATMEGAVRSGYLAAESVIRSSGTRDASFLAPNLAASGLMRLFG